MGCSGAGTLGASSSGKAVLGSGRPVRSWTATREAIGVSFALGKTPAEIGNLVPLLGDGGVFGRQLGPMSALGRAAVLGELHLVGDAGGLQRLALQGPRPTDRPTSLIERAAGSGKIVGRTTGPRGLIRYGPVSGHKANDGPVR